MHILYNTPILITYTNYIVSTLVYCIYLIFCTLDYITATIFTVYILFCFIYN
nr:MAG TPA: hypothetical protein [Caudoviricetes sp.]DAO24195.1 MAG TPA: hypothetical protein [Caudoviricetes sp.]